MRGKAFRVREQRFHDGITPAYAGKSFKYYYTLFCVQDHPRLCGEKLNSENKCKFQSGSPPPMRGKETTQCVGSCLFRITPAYAGKSLGSILIRSHIQDHPRLCGEKYCFGVRVDSSVGSPPPMRGKGFSSGLPNK